MNDVTAERPLGPGKHNASGITGSVLAVTTTIGFFGLLGLFAWRDIPAGSRDLVNIMLGTLAGGWTAIVSYYFGSSVGRDQPSTPPTAEDRRSALN